MAPSVNWDAHLAAVRTARVAAVLSFLGLVLAWVVPVGAILALGVGVHFGRFHLGSGTLTVASFIDLAFIVLFGALLSLVAVIVYAVAFNRLRKINPGFGAAFGLTIVGLVGLLLIVLGAAILAVQVLQAVACSSSSSFSSCFNIYSTVGPVFSIFGGLFLALLGWIGLVIGIYRIGSRYGSTLTSVGGILMIIPVVGIIAPILVLVGMQSVVERVRARTIPPVPVG
jgi:hypothetical protein